MGERTPVSTTHEERRSRRDRVLRARQDLARAERDLIALGPGDVLPGVNLLLRAGGWCVVAPCTQILEVCEVELRPAAAPGPQAAGDFVYRGRRVVAFDLAALVGAPRPAPREATVVVFSALEPFGIVVDEVALAGTRATLVPGDPGSPQRTWRHAHVLVECDGSVLPLLDVEALARTAAARSSTHDEAKARAEERSLEEIDAVERVLSARGLSLCPRLRRQMRTYCRAAAAEGRAPPHLPRILGGDSGAVCGLLDSISSLDTSFFRDLRQLEALARRLVNAADASRELRLWSAGCGTGEEAYSVAMLLAAARPFGRDRVLATDVSTAALAHARRAVYSRGAILEPHPLLARFLEEGDGGLVVAAEVQERVTFRSGDLRDPAPDRGLDAVLCRHTLELLEPAAAARALRTLVGALRPGGYLLLGCTETALAGGLPLERIDENGAVVFRRPADARRPRVIPLRTADDR